MFSFWWGGGVATEQDDEEAIEVLSLPKMIGMYVCMADTSIWHASVVATLFGIRSGSMCTACVDSETDGVDRLCLDQTFAICSILLSSFFLSLILVGETETSSPLWIYCLRLLVVMAKSMRASHVPFTKLPNHMRKDYFNLMLSIWWDILHFSIFISNPAT